MTDKPEAAPNAKWQLEIWFNEALKLGVKSRDSLRAHFLVGDETQTQELLQSACARHSLEYIDVDLARKDLTPETLHGSLGIKTHRLFKSKAAPKVKCCLFRNLSATTSDFRDAMIGLAKNRRCGPLYYPINWLAFVHMETEESIIQLLPKRLLLDACWISTTQGTDVGKTSVEEIMGVKIKRQQNIRYFRGKLGPRKKKKKK